MTFGNPTKLIVDGKTFNLLSDKAGSVKNEVFKDAHDINATICCHNLDYSKFSELLSQANRSFYQQGGKTPISNIPTAGTAHYLGSWDGYIETNTRWSTNAGNHEGASKAKFDVDFANKTLTGQLIAENRIEPTFNINAKIEQNGFKGTASTGTNSFALDIGNIHAPKIAHIRNAEVSGRFYGPNAAELRGSLSGNDNSLLYDKQDEKFGQYLGRNAKLKMMNKPI